jgi:homogentisate 1,2-dioxygenase
VFRRVFKDRFNRFMSADFILPTELETHDEKRRLLIKIKEQMHEVVYANASFDRIVGMGIIPYGFSIISHFTK